MLTKDQALTKLIIGHSIPCAKAESMIAEAEATGAYEGSHTAVYLDLVKGDFQVIDHR